MKKLWKILRFALPYKGHALLNILFNIFGVLFGLVSLTLLVPILQILFKQTPLINVAPSPITWDQITNTKLLAANFNYSISQYIVESGAPHALFVICIVLVVLFFLKIYKYSSNFFIYI